MFWFWWCWSIVGFSFDFSLNSISYVVPYLMLFLFVHTSPPKSHSALMVCCAHLVLFLFISLWYIICVVVHSLLMRPLTIWSHPMEFWVIMAFCTCRWRGLDILKWVVWGGIFLIQAYIWEVIVCVMIGQVLIFEVFVLVSPGLLIVLAGVPSDCKRNSGHQCLPSCYKWGILVWLFLGGRFDVVFCELVSNCGYICLLWLF